MIRPYLFLADVEIFGEHFGFDAQVIPPRWGNRLGNTVYTVCLVIKDL